MDYPNNREEKIMIPTAEGDIVEFKKTSVGGKFIKNQGILLIGASTDSIAKKVTKKWLETLFPERIIPIEFLKISQNNLSTFVTNHARTVIAISHSEVKGLQTIRNRIGNMSSAR